MRYVGIDPSTKTGLVVLDEQGNVLVAEEKELKNITDPKRMSMLIDWVWKETMRHNWKEADVEGDVIKIAIEGFSYNSKGKGVDFQYGLGWGIRIKFHQYNVAYIDVSPASVKKFATGKGTTKKDNMIIPIYDRWGFQHESDNVRDAYVLAQIARFKHLQLDMTKFQQEVIAKL